MHEIDRLNAVSRFTTLEASVTADLNNIIDLAAQICNTPVALVTLVDEHVQWFKAAKGVNMESTDRSIAFCHHTIQQSGVMEIPNMLADERFIGNPLVTEAPNVRFYAGATLTTNDGQNIGTLCVVDMEARQLNDMQRTALKTLSKQVMHLMEASWTMRMLQERHEQTELQKKIIEESELKLRAVFDSSKDTHMLIDKKMEILAFNKAANDFFVQHTGKPLQAGEHVNQIVSARTFAELLPYFEKAFNGGTIKIEWKIANAAIESWREIEFTPINGANGDVIGVAANSTDITERKLQEDQINIQNAALTRIAIIQSHELRRPVASLLGIMALLKLEQAKAENEYMEMLEYTVKELDEKIREIVKDSENTINNFLSVVA
ncbi:GAF domain-containing protein [Mucilaginibacter auburnensis]|uniref:PAS domain S-box-containing protein n=1 Tax=Mucilaginibacter auburnensis TaxID=1457233 RepID=A0A2H9VN15_9SPHI|nr:GAF domain-containing protein [Mucilaginibacter auburnensis]PJJ79722.1 PAS domain S-box-containing protein [Mucilaginibacter auburnensis]